MASGEVPAQVETMIQAAMDFHRQGRLAEAERLYRSVLASDPDQFDALHLLGILRLQQGNPAEALPLISRAVKNRPAATDALCNLSVALLALQRYEEALTACDRILAANPADSETLYNRAIALTHLRRREEALAGFDEVLTSRPGHAGALYNRGNVLVELDRYEEALVSYDRCLTVAGNHVDALLNRGNVLAKLGRFEEALRAFERVIALDPRHVPALSNRGNALRKLRRSAEAADSCRRAVALNPNHVDALCNLGSALADLNRPDEALSAFDQALALTPDDADVLNSRGNVLSKLGRYDAAAAAYDLALAKKPDHLYALGGLAHSRQFLCDWNGVAALVPTLEKAISNSSCVIAPFTALGAVDDAAKHRQCAEYFVRHEISPAPGLAPAHYSGHQRIRLGYLSGDFRQHPVGYLIADLFGRHDRKRFEVHGFSFGPDDQSDVRARIMRSMDHFHDIAIRSDRDAAKLVNDLQIDLLVDLSGHTDGARPGILAQRPAPVQIAYLGYPGTMGADFIDYAFADPVVLPFDNQPFYAEHIVHLPDCYLVNDSIKTIASGTLSRAQVGLPEEGFVFCCFNNNFKISAEVFQIWMTLLSRLSGSVLWLSQMNAAAMSNLWDAARRQDVDPARLIFAPKVPLMADHLARQRLADLFLDTLPYNAHTTASDALWAGLPVLTCRGRTFAGRVAASLLYAVGLPELVTDSLDDYEALALKLATDAALLASIRGKLEQNRLTTPLFDTGRFCRHLEAAFETMWDISQRGEKPRSFAVDRLDG